MKFYILVALGIITRVVSNEELKCKPRPGCHFSGCDPTAGPSFIVLDRNEYPLTCEATDIREMIAQNEKNFRSLMNITLGRFQQTSKLTHEIQNLKSQVANLTMTNNELIQDFNKFVAETMSRLEKLETEIARSDPISVNIPKTPQSSSTVPILTLAIQTETHGLVYDACKTSTSGGCFWIAMIEQAQTNFTRANETCASYGSVLAVIPDRKTYDEITMNMRKKLTAEWNIISCWLGMTYNVTTGEIHPPGAYNETWIEEKRSYNQFATNLLVRIRRTRDPNWEGLYNQIKSALYGGAVCWKPKI